MHEIAVRNGAVAWRDETRAPAARLAVSGITGRVFEVAWPLRGPSRVHLAMSTPGGGSVRVTGRAGLDPLFTEVRVAGNGVALGPWQPYLPTTARVNGSADLDLAIAVPEGAAPRATPRGTAALANVDVRDRERTLIRIQRATATGIELEWPERLAIGRIAVGGPWILFERDDKGRLPLRGVSTSPAKPARIDLSGQVASTGDLTVAGGAARAGRDAREGGPGSPPRRQRARRRASSPVASRYDPAPAGGVPAGTVIAARRSITIITALVSWSARPAAIAACS